MCPKPIALNFTSLLDFLDFLLRGSEVSKQVIICMTREAFVRRLLNPNSSSDAVVGVELENASAVMLQKLLTPNLNNLSKTQRVSITFTPTVLHLRAYLASRDGFLDATISGRPEFGMTTKSPPLLIVIYSFLDLHLSTSDFSAQGLSRTMALIVEAVNKAKVRLLMAECDRAVEQEIQPEEDDADTAIGSARQQLINPYTMEVPVLNRALGFGRDGLHWAGKTVQVGRILARWCSFPCN